MPYTDRVGLFQGRLGIDAEGEPEYSAAVPRQNSPPATRNDLQELEQKFDARLEQMEARIMARFDVLMENLVHDFRGAQKDKIEMHEDKLQAHDDRLTRLEKQAGLAAA